MPQKGICKGEWGHQLRKAYQAIEKEKGIELVSSIPKFVVPRAGLGTIWHMEFQQSGIVVIYFLFMKACDPVCDPIVAVTYVKI